MSEILNPWYRSNITRIPFRIDEVSSALKERVQDIVLKKEITNAHHPFENKIYYKLSPKNRASYVIHSLLWLTDLDIQNLYDCMHADSKQAPYDIAFLLTEACKQRNTEKTIPFISIRPEHIHEIVHASTVDPTTWWEFSLEIPNHSLERDFQTLTWFEWLLYEYMRLAAKLPRRPGKFTFCDFDDTLYSREKQLENNELAANRGNAWNLIMINKYGIDWMMKEYYNESIPSWILDKKDPLNFLTLTAWVEEYQRAKIKTVWIDSYPAVITEDGLQKIMALLRYVIYKLKYIPEALEIYEDRTHHFIDYKDLIEQVLQTKLTIKHVDMDGNRWYEDIVTI